MRIVVVGAGEVGFDVAQDLTQDGHDVVVIENDPEKATRAENELDVLLIRGNGARPNVLERAGVEPDGETDMLIACTNHDEVNLFACWIARRMGVPHVLARAVSLEFTDSSMWRQELGIDQMISPERAVSREIENLLEVRSAVHSVEIGDGSVGIYVFRIREGAPACDSTPRKIRARFPHLTTVMVYVEREGESFVPEADTPFREGDLCYSFCYKKQIHDVEEIYRPKGENQTLKRVFIVGGGKIGFLTAELLQSRVHGVDVRLIDIDREKCKKIASELPGITLLWGDGADETLLIQERISSSDAIVAATDSDELNLMVCIQAKVFGVQKSIAVIRRKSYLKLSEYIPVDAIVNRNQAISSAILSSVRHPGHEGVLTVLDAVEAEALSVTIPPNSSAIGVTLKDLPLPSGVILGAIDRQGEIFIPSGNASLQAADKAIIFSTTEKMLLALDIMETERS